MTKAIKEYETTANGVWISKTTLKKGYTVVDFIPKAQLERFLREINAKPQG